MYFVMKARNPIFGGFLEEEDKRKKKGKEEEEEKEDKVLRRGRSI